jgi:hypothetical protein
MTFETQVTQTKLTDVPISVTKQVQDGCVTASARSFVPHLGVDFETDFLPKLQEYSLDLGNPENNHMLGVAIVAAEKNLDVEIHRRISLEDDVLPENAPQRAKLIHPQVVAIINDLAGQGKIKLAVDELNEQTLLQKLSAKIADGSYALVILDWDKWNLEAQKKFGNPRHIVTVFKVDGTNIQVIDPSIDVRDNPVNTTIEKLFSALNEKQQIIFIGNKKAL